MFRYGPGFHHGPGVVGWFFLAMLAALVVVGVIALVRLWSAPRGRLAHLHAGQMPIPPADPALTELRVRYARGDISWEDYSRRANDLGYPIYPASGPVPGMSPPGAQPPPQTQ